MNFTVLDACIVAAYLGGIALFGIRSGGRQASAKDYFLSESAVPWWAVCFAIVATETSALTFLSVPGISYISNINFLQLSIGYLIGRIIVATVFIPRYFRGELSTAYAYLGTRFGPSMRSTASVTFMGTRLFADGVRLYTTAIPLALLLKGFHVFPGMSDTTFYVISIIVLSALTLVYVFLGGVRAVIWTDVIQLFVYVIGAVAALWVLLSLLPNGWSAAFSTPEMQAKLGLFNTGPGGGWSSFFAAPYTLAASVLGGAFLSMASHGTDQIIVQRVIATKSRRPAQKAMIMSGVIVLVQFAMFLLIGVLLYVHSGPGQQPNEVFASFILKELPTGLTGLIIAGILAAAMSTLSGSISALASSTVMDIILPLTGAKWDEDLALRRSRLISLIWGIALIAVATLFISTSRTVVELALSIASYTYGGLLGVFLLGMLSRTAHERAAMTGLFCGIAGMTSIILFTNVAWTWYTLAGSAITVLAGLLSTQFIPARTEVTA